MSKFRVDFHVHTTSSSDGRSTLQEQIESAKRVGLHAIAITDHNRCTDVSSETDGILLIPGCEVSSACGHILGLFLERTIDLPSGGTLPTGDEAVAAIRAAGGLAVLAHPFQQPWREEKDLPEDADGVEVCNARGDLKRNNANALAAELADRRGVFSTGGSDAHHSDEVGYAYTEIEADTLTLQSLRSALQQKQCRAVLVRHTSYTQKALSQWESARKKSFARRAKGILYLLRGLYKDILQKKKR